MLFVIGLIDSISNTKLEKIRSKTEPLGIPPHPLYGHITFATYLGDSDAAFIASCKEILRNFDPFLIHLEKIEQLPNSAIIAAFPTKEKEVAAIHKNIFDVWRDFLTPWTQEEIWQPHITLLKDAEADLNAVLHCIQDTFTPFNAKISRIEFSCVSENGFKIVDAIDLVQNSIA